ncbi:glycosyl transferase family protein [Sphingorhabdus sp.]|uniref:glycosyl transferase family protein n=2 Tax=Sphingorhabdus sp. TaxID=1902408 RepID=UPI003BAEA528
MLIDPPKLQIFWQIMLDCQTELLLFSAVWFLVGALDDLLVDLIWIGRTAYRWAARYRNKPPMRAHELSRPKNPGMMAVFVAAWQEAEVIGAMIGQCRNSWSDKDTIFRIYVGCYPNDAASIRSALKAAKGSDSIRLVLCDKPGPTTKADCLNRLWRALLSDELAGGYKFKALILHDAEDCVHPDELQLYDYLIEKGSAVQLPVVPVSLKSSAWISGHYADEFAEAHGKSLVVREAIGAAVPLAGVGCAIERNQIGRIALARGGNPFDPESLTEDYELGLAIGRDRGKVIFAAIHDECGDLVATRACFPDRLDTAVRQKARWTIGIALAGWDRLGWEGGWAEFWMRLRDRKAPLAALVLLTAYLCIILTALLMLGKAAGQVVFPAYSPLIRGLLLANGCMLLWRLAVRAAFVGRLYGSREALRSIPRTIIANIIAIMAARRACWQYLLHMKGGVLAWDKTNHSNFPSQVARDG